MKNRYILRRIRGNLLGDSYYIEDDEYGHPVKDAHLVTREDFVREVCRLNALSNQENTVMLDITNSINE